MEQIQSERPGRKFLALAFLLPFLGYSLVMLAGRFSPFAAGCKRIFPLLIFEMRHLRANPRKLLFCWSAAAPETRKKPTAPPDVFFAVSMYRNAIL